MRFPGKRFALSISSKAFVAELNWCILWDRVDYFWIVVPPHAWIDSRDELEGYSQLGKGSSGDVISWIGCGVAAVPF